MNKFTIIGSITVILLATMISNAKAQDTKYKSAYFAGGCFWCMESDFEKLDGVKDVISGYMGGHTKNPTYEQSATGRTGHREAARIIYDPKVISYKELLKKFWRSVDMFDADGQFCDRGFQYSTAIFVTNKQERKLAEESKHNTQKLFEEKIVTPIIDEDVFYKAEDYHQGYYLENPIRYKYYRSRCGRNKRIADIWADEE